jgi:hypothetical protein
VSTALDPWVVGDVMDAKWFFQISLMLLALGGAIWPQAIYRYLERNTHVDNTEGLRRSCAPSTVRFVSVVLLAAMLFAVLRRLSG